MSFLAGRLAATEGAYFLQESKNVAGRLASKLPPPGPTTASTSAAASAGNAESAADVLPEILRHGVPIKAVPPPGDPTLSGNAKWVLPFAPGTVGLHPDALNPLRAYVSLPQTTFGPKRWQLAEQETYVLASTANELRRERHPRPMDPEKLKAVIAGYSQIGKAFLGATLITFGGMTALFMYTANKLELRTPDNIRAKGRDALQPQAEMLREAMVPLRSWAENMSKKWSIGEDSPSKEKKPFVRELSKAFGAPR